MAVPDARVVAGQAGGRNRATAALPSATLRRVRGDVPGRPLARRLSIAAICLLAAAASGYWWRGLRAAPAIPGFRDVVARCQAAVVGVRCLLHPAAAGSTREGSGFLCHADGLVLTNAHLVADRLLVLVDVAERGRFVAEVVGEDPLTDLAVLRLAADAERPLPALELADSERVCAGDWVLTLGRPMTLGTTVTAGLVSSPGRHLPLDEAGITASYLQFSAAVNPGSSGSPVLDAEGRVVGMTTGKCREGEGLAFAVPSRLISWVLARMEEHGGKVPRGYLGVSLAPGRAAGRGALVTEVEPGGPAWRAGIRPGDVVVRFDGEAIEGAEHLYEMIIQALPEREVGIEVRSPPAAAPRRMLAVLGMVKAPMQATERSGARS
jgi:S1-C subfamily serine protease